MQRWQGEWRPSHKILPSTVWDNALSLHFKYPVIWFLHQVTRHGLCCHFKFMGIDLYGTWTLIFSRYSLPFSPTLCFLFSLFCLSFASSFFIIYSLTLNLKSVPIPYPLAHVMILQRATLSLLCLFWFLSVCPWFYASSLYIHNIFSTSILLFHQGKKFLQNICRYLWEYISKGNNLHELIRNVWL